MPEEGIEPTRALSPPDFESGASASFTTPARNERFGFYQQLARTARRSVLAAWIANAFLICQSSENSVWVEADLP